MRPIQERTVDVLGSMSGILRTSGLEGRAAAQLEERAKRLDDLARRVDEPCKVAVVGRVNTGKSTFINALLGEDLASVGRTETTATINRFCHDPEGPSIFCHRLDGSRERVDREWVEKLQGHDAATLRLAAEIEHLEFRLPSEALRTIDLVDTPGTGAVVAAHEEAMADALGLRSLRQRHHEESRRRAESADAIIYLVDTRVADGDQRILQSFRDDVMEGVNAFNALGILSKVDSAPEILARRHALAESVQDQLHAELATVLPVSAELERVLDRLPEKDLRARIETLRRASDDELSQLLEGPEIFTSLEIEGALSKQERSALLEGIRWPIFSVIARTAQERHLEPPQVVARLQEVAGMSAVRDLLQLRFLERGPLLRCHGILREAKRLVREVRFELLTRIREGELEDPRRTRFLDFLRQSQGPGTVKRELTDFVEEQLSATSRRLAEIVERLEDSCSGLATELESDEGDLQAWGRMRKQLDSFTPEERKELRALFGLEGLDLDSRISSSVDPQHLRGRILLWRDHAERAPRGSARRRVARQATKRYTSILERYLHDPA